MELICITIIFLGGLTWLSLYITGDHHKFAEPNVYRICKKNDKYYIQVFISDFRDYTHRQSWRDVKISDEDGGKYFDSYGDAKKEVKVLIDREKRNFWTSQVNKDDVVEYL